MALCGIEMYGYLWLVLLPLPSRSVSLAPKHQLSFVCWWWWWLWLCFVFIYYHTATVTEFVAISVCFLVFGSCSLCNGLIDDCGIKLCGWGCTAWVLLNIIFYGSTRRVFNHKSKHWKSCLKQGVAEPWTLGFVIKLSFWLLWIGASGHLGLCHHECLYTTPTPPPPPPFLPLSLLLITGGSKGNMSSPVWTEWVG